MNSTRGGLTKGVAMLSTQIESNVEDAITGRRKNTRSKRVSELDTKAMKRCDGQHTECDYDAKIRMGELPRAAAGRCLTRACLRTSVVLATHDNESHQAIPHLFIGLVLFRTLGRCGFAEVRSVLCFGKGSRIQVGK